METGHETLVLGEPLLFQFLSWLVFGSLSPETNIILHPVAFAGWIGLFVTALNLIPVGQLDGGHVSYALFPEYHRYVSLGCLGLLLVCGLFFWYGWLFWAALIFPGLAPSAALLSLGAAGPAPPGFGFHHHPGVHPDLQPGALQPGVMKGDLQL